MLNQNVNIKILTSAVLYEFHSKFKISSLEAKLTHWYPNIQVGTLIGFIILTTFESRVKSLYMRLITLDYTLNKIL